MSAVMKPVPTRLELPITRAMPRKLIVEWDAGEFGLLIHAHAFVRNAQKAMLSVAFGAAHQVKDGRLVRNGHGNTLWLRHTQFELTASEADEVERVFVPLGLTVSSELA